jgi:hypothetical protein
MSQCIIRIETMSDEAVVEGLAMSPQEIADVLLTLDPDDLTDVIVALEMKDLS